MLKLSGFPRVDLVGGTLDIYPINLILEQVVTINIAIDLETKIEINEIDSSNLIIHSINYNSSKTISLNDLNDSSFFKDGIFSDSKFKELSFVLKLISYFRPKDGLEIKLDAKAPHGSGLGGSSTLGVSLYKALCQKLNREFDPTRAIEIVRNHEALVLNQGVPGYQDYYPSMFGGILALKADMNKVQVKQLYSSEFSEYLEKNIVLGFTGKNRSSGINNWAVYKNFFDQDKKTIEGLREINNISKKCHDFIKSDKFDEVPNCILQEGKVRESLFPNILTPEMKNLNSNLGSKMKVCGAGGGGCFILIGEDQELYKKSIVNSSMEVLPFKIKGPIE